MQDEALLCGRFVEPFSCDLDRQQLGDRSRRLLIPGRQDLCVHAQLDDRRRVPQPRADHVDRYGQLDALSS